MPCAATPSWQACCPSPACFIANPAVTYSGQEVLQGEGGEQGDPLMPGLYQHAALLHLYAQLRPGEGLYAFLDDVYITTAPERTLYALQAAQDSWSRLANIQVHLGKTQAWNAAGEEPPGLVAALPRLDGDPPSWTGSWALPPEEQGLIVLGSPLGSPEYHQPVG